MLGADSAGQTDALVLRTAGLSEWLVCETDEQYYETALQLIENPTRRTEALAGLAREQIRGNLVANQERQTVDPFPEMIWELYRIRHTQIQASDQRMFHYSDWLVS